MNYELSDPHWKYLVVGKLNCKFELLAVKLLMNRIRVKISLGDDEETVNDCINEVHNFFKKNEKYAEKDLLKIFEQEIK